MQAIRSNIARTYIRLFKIVRIRHIYVVDHEIISSDIDRSCDVYSSLKFVNSLDENGLLICVLYRLMDFVYCRIYSPNILCDFHCRSYTSTFIATVQL